MTVRASVSRSRYGSMGGLARRTMNHVFSSRNNRVGLFNRNRGAGSQTKTQRKGRDTGSTTRYADSAIMYRRRGAPKKLRNRMRRFAARVQSVIDGEVGLQVAIIPQATSTTGYTSSVSITTLLNQQSTALIPGLYSMTGNHPDSSTNQNWDDIYLIFQQYKVSGAVNNDTILEFTSACWNCTMCNDGAAVAFVDVYECVARKNYKNASDPAGQFTGLLPDNTQFTGSQAKVITGTQLGVTPFDNPFFCEMWKILKVRRIKLEVGAVASLQFRDPKHRKIEYQSQVQFNTQVRGITRCWIPIVYGAPQVSSGNNMASTTKVTINATRNYHFRQLSTSTPSAAAIQ